MRKYVRIRNVNRRRVRPSCPYVPRTNLSPASRRLCRSAALRGLRPARPGGAAGAARLRPVPDPRGVRGGRRPRAQLVRRRLRGPPVAQRPGDRGGAGARPVRVSPRESRDRRPQRKESSRDLQPRHRAHRPGRPVARHPPAPVPRARPRTRSRKSRLRGPVQGPPHAAGAADARGTRPGGPDRPRVGARRGRRSAAAPCVRRPAGHHRRRRRTGGGRPGQARPRPCPPCPRPRAVGPDRGPARPGRRAPRPGRARPRRMPSHGPPLRVGAGGDRGPGPGGRTLPLVRLGLVASPSRPEDGALREPRVPLHGRGLRLRGRPRAPSHLGRDRMGTTSLDPAAIAGLVDREAV